MKSKHLLLMLLLALCAPWAANAQNRSIVEIGTGTSVTYYPMPGFFGFQYDVYLYTPTAAPELGVDSDISSIAYNIYSISSSTGATIEIWVKDVDASYALATSTTFADYTNGATKGTASALLRAVLRMARTTTPFCLPMRERLHPSPSDTGLRMRLTEH